MERYEQKGNIVDDRQSLDDALFELRKKRLDDDSYNIVEPISAMCYYIRKPRFNPRDVIGKHTCNNCGKKFGEDKEEVIYKCKKQQYEKFKSSKLSGQLGLPCIVNIMKLAYLYSLYATKPANGLESKEQGADKKIIDRMIEISKQRDVLGYESKVIDDKILKNHKRDDSNQILEDQNLFDNYIAFLNTIERINDQQVEHIKDIDFGLLKNEISFSQWEELVGDCTGYCYKEDHFYSEIKSIAKKYIDAGYDVILNYYCDNCIKQHEGLHRIEFGIRFDKKEKYHYSYPVNFFPKNEESTLSDYRVVLEFLQGKQSYNELMQNKRQSILGDERYDKIKIETALSKILNVKITYDKAEVRKMINMLIIRELSKNVPQRIFSDDILKDDLNRYFVPIKDYDKCICAKRISQKLLEEVDDNQRFNLDEIVAFYNIVLYIIKPSCYYRTEDVLFQIKNISKRIHKNFSLSDIQYCIKYLNLHSYEEELTLAINKYCEKNAENMILGYDKFYKIIDCFLNTRPEDLGTEDPSKIVDIFVKMIKKVIEGDE